MARIGEGLRGRWEEGDGLDALGAAVLANHQPHRRPGLRAGAPRAHGRASRPGRRIGRVV